jgi:hypothetical protein
MAPADCGAARCARPDYAEIFMPPANNVSCSKRFAFVVITPASDCPGNLLRQAWRCEEGTRTLA